MMGLEDIRWRKIDVTPAADNKKLYTGIDLVERALELHEKKRLLLLELRRTLIHQVVKPS